MVGGPQDYRDTPSPLHLQRDLGLSIIMSNLGSQYLSGKSLGSSYFDVQYKFFPIWKPDSWNTFCSTYNSDTKKFSMYTNKKLVFEYENVEFVRKPAQDNVVLLNAFSFAVNDYIYPFDGAITDLQIWSRIFEEGEIQNWSECMGMESGDFFQWENAEFKFIGDIETIEVEESSICSRKTTERFLAFPEKLNFVDSVKFCKKVGGEIAVANDFETVEKMQNALSSFRDTDTCPMLVYTGNFEFRIIKW